MGMPKWESHGTSQMKIKVGPTWDQHGHAQVGMPRCVPSENKSGSQLGPYWACPGMSQIKIKWRHGTHLGVKWVAVGK